MIYSLGVSYVGMNGLFTSVLQILNIAELGISSAMIFSMYEPIAKKNDKKICELLKLYRVYYLFIGTIILILGLILLPFLPKLISGKVPEDINIYYLFLLYLVSTVLSYWLFAYRSSLLEAHQRNDIISKIQIISSTIQFAVQIILLVIFKNYYLYIIAQLFIQILHQLWVYLYAKKMYPNLKPMGEIDEKVKKSITEKVRDLATAKFGAVILNSSDTVVISSFLGLTTLAIYQNYYFLVTSIISILATIMYGALAGIGNSLVLETREKNFYDFKSISFLFSWIVCICTSCFLCLFQPFMKIWMGEKMMLPFPVVIMLCVYFFLYEYNQLFNLYKDAAGLWHEDRFRPLITSLTNLFLNLLMVRYAGLYGIIFSTVISMLFVGIPWLLHNLFHSLFKQRLSAYLKSLMVYVFISLCSCTVSYVISISIDHEGISGLILKGMIAVVVPCAFYALFFRKNEYFMYAVKRLRVLVKKVDNKKQEK